MITYRTFTAISLAALAIGLAACGGGGSANGGAPPPVAVAPAPSPTPPPMPAPSPSPTPSPTPAPASALIANAAVGQSLIAPLSCATGSVTAVTETDGSRRQTGIGAINDLQIEDNNGGAGLSIGYRASDTYDLQLGFDDPITSASPAQKRTPLATAYDYFRDSFQELEIYRNVLPQKFDFVTLGRLSQAGTFRFGDATTCFYAAGPSSSPLPATGVASYSGLVDGIALLGGRATRLFGSPAAASVNFSARTGTVRIDLATRELPFGDFLSSTPTPIGSATAQLVLPPGDGQNYFARQAPLTGPDGSTGTISGLAFNGGAALGLVFELHYPNGDRVFGAVAVERPSP